MKIRWKKVFYFMFLLGSMFGLKNVVGQNDSINNTNIESILSENSFQISGVIRGSSNNYLMPFCNVILLNSNNDTLQMALSDFDGCFQFDKVPKGFYQIKISQIGCICEQTNIFEVFEDFEIKIDCLKEIHIKMTTTTLCYIVAVPQNFGFDDYQFRTYRDYNIDGKYWYKKPKNLR
jgi:hypothetical protein